MEEPADANVKDRTTIGNSDAVTSVANIDQNNQMRHGPLTRPFLFHSIDIVLPVSGYSGGTSPPPPSVKTWREWQHRQHIGKGCNYEEIPGKISHP